MLKIFPVLAFALLVTPCSAQVIDSFTEPVQQSNVAAAESGVIDSIVVTEGQTVRRGDTLAMLDHDALRQSLRIAELRAKSTSEIRSAEATLRIRKTRRDTLEPLLEKGHANPAEVEEAVVEHEIAMSDVEIAREKHAEYRLEVDRIKAQIKARTIASPIDGVVSELHYRLGEYVSTAKPQFATVVQLDQLLVRFYLFEDTVVQLAKDQQVSLVLRVGDRQQQIAGTIRFVSPVTDADSGTARVDVVIDNAPGNYRSGSRCRWIGLPAAKVARR
ncbi:efflux RND transporter periplasmic adaptor subunit [Stieleria marina]|uniref:Macrolide transporter subunit MacA n=1 Tax=Stieleria marina TaxID=1930275 RepID=A0A517NVT0_9BACT|nr:macrolide transporter subunit MacA [Planctomycetes bacterium K23_9]